MCARATQLLMNGSNQLRLLHDDGGGDRMLRGRPTAGNHGDGASHEDIRWRQQATRKIEEDEVHTSQGVLIKNKYILL
ncbi:hypothetical protein Csa_018452, partial [Cucumis sativus]